jgi:hypothetical protein
MACPRWLGRSSKSICKEELVTMKPEVLRRLQGVESVKAMLLVAAFELARRGLQKGLAARTLI